MPVILTLIVLVIAIVYAGICHAKVASLEKKLIYKDIEVHRLRLQLLDADNYRRQVKIVQESVANMRTYRGD